MARNAIQVDPALAGAAACVTALSLKYNVQCTKYNGERKRGFAARISKFSILNYKF